MNINLRDKHLIIVQSEKGGVGKTTVAEALVTSFHATNQTAQVADCDDGNSGFIRRNGNGSAVPLWWKAKASEVEGWCNQHFSQHDTIILDCGANLLASNAKVKEFLGALAVLLADGGCRISPFAVASTNAPGTDELVHSMRKALAPFGTVRLIRNNQDGSQEFPVTLTTAKMPSATFPQIEAGIVSARLLQCAPLIETLRNPPPGHTVAMDRLAISIAQFLAEPAIAEVVTPGAAAAVRAIARSKQLPLYYKVNTLSSATDAALLANAALYQAYCHLYKVARATEKDQASIANAALNFIQAETQLAQSL